MTGTCTGGDKGLQGMAGAYSGKHGMYTGVVMGLQEYKGYMYINDYHDRINGKNVKIER